jgi:hypothetical protein
MDTASRSHSERQKAHPRARKQAQRRQNGRIAGLAIGFVAATRADAEAA